MNATAAGADYIATIMVILSEIIEAIANSIYTAAQNATQMMALANVIFANQPEGAGPIYRSDIYLTHQLVNTGSHIQHIHHSNALAGIEGSAAGKSRAKKEVEISTSLKWLERFEAASQMSPEIWGSSLFSHQLHTSKHTLR